MPGYCCGHSGYISPDKAELLNRLEAAGVDMPDLARIWGPSEGWAWRLVNTRGGPPAAGPVGSPWTVRALVEAPAIAVVAQADGTRVVTPA